MQCTVAGSQAAATSKMELVVTKVINGWQW